MNNDLTAALGKTVGIMEAMPYLKLEEMDVMDQLYFLGAQIKYAADVEPLIDKYICSEEILSKLKEENSDKFIDILNFFQNKQGVS